MGGGGGGAFAARRAKTLIVLGGRSAASSVNSTTISSGARGGWIAAMDGDGCIGEGRDDEMEMQSFWLRAVIGGEAAG